MNLWVRLMQRLSGNRTSFASASSLPPVKPTQEDQTSINEPKNDLNVLEKEKHIHGPIFPSSPPALSVKFLLMSLLVSGREMHPVLESIIPSLQMLAVTKYSAQAEGVISRISLFLQKGCCFFEMLLTRNIKVK